MVLLWKLVDYPKLFRNTLLSLCELNVFKPVGWYSLILWILQWDIEHSYDAWQTQKLSHDHGTRYVNIFSPVEQMIIN